jgi:hypothetical protein
MFWLQPFFNKCLRRSNPKRLLAETTAGLGGFNGELAVFPEFVAGIMEGIVVAAFVDSVEATAGLGA